MTAPDDPAESFRERAEHTIKFHMTSVKKFRTLLTTGSLPPVDGIDDRFNILEAHVAGLSAALLDLADQLDALLRRKPE